MYSTHPTDGRTLASRELIIDIINMGLERKPAVRVKYHSVHCRGVAHQDKWEMSVLRTVPIWRPADFAKEFTLGD